MEEQFRKYRKFLSEENEIINKENPISLLQSDFNNNKIHVYDFVDSMYHWNKALHVIANNLKNTDISKIEIIDDCVVYTTKKMNIKLTFNGNDRRAVPFDLLSFGEYEPEELDILNQIIDEKSVLLDIGANIGWYAINWAKTFPKTTIHAFEPIPETHDFCEKNIQLNQIHNVHLHQIAISDRDGTQQYFFSPETSVLASSQNIMDYENALKVSVKVATLDTFVKNNISEERIDLLKCDVEGGEFACIKGGLQTLKRDKPIIILELYHEWSKKFDYYPDEVLHFLSDLGYGAFLPKDGKLERVENYLANDYSRQNYFFLHKEHHANIIKSMEISLTPYV